MAARRKLALLLSGGGMFGAYQAGVWAGVSEYLQPDLVVGASVGSLNGWAIAGGCMPEALTRRWLEVDTSAAERLRLPRTPFDGVLGSDYLEQWTRELVSEFQPKAPFGLVLTELWRLRPVLVRGEEVTWQHLAGSCGVLGLLRQQKIGGVRYTDGGLLNVLPIWAAEALGADAILGVNVMPPLPHPVRGAMRMLRKTTARHTATRATPRLILAPDPPLGRAVEMARHRRPEIERWIDQGYADARTAKRQILELAAS